MSEIKHTHTPWTVNAGYIVGCSDPANADTIAVFNAPPGDDDARFIETACNAHDALVAALRAAVEQEEANGCADGEPMPWLIQARALLAMVAP